MYKRQDLRAAITGLPYALAESDAHYPRGSTIGSGFGGNGTFPDASSFNTVWFISPTGDDTTGTGSSSSPFLTFNTALDASQSGDGIYLMPGTHRWPVHYDDSYTSSAIADNLKTLHIWGANQATIVEAYGADSPTSGFQSARDFNVFHLQGANTVVSNFTVHFSPNRGTNYSNAIYRNSSTTAELRNMHIINISDTHSWSYSYANSTSGRPDVYNSVFNARGRSQGDYTGSPEYFNTLFTSTPNRGTFTNSLTRAVTDNDLYTSSAPSDLRDGSNVTVIGTGGGLYAWELP